SSSGCSPSLGSISRYVHTRGKGQRWYALAWIATASPRHHLLVRRHLRSGELAFHLSAARENFSRR
ncbi:MAG TPA: hypothetical protein VNV66_08570, partial [Pilimelia sp.]|nr:hypothetical protein [Pilimelia sp.]